MGEPARRSVVREHDFERDLRRLLGPDSAATDEFVQAAEWVLSLDPLVGVQVAPGSIVWALPMAPVAGRSVTLYYEFDESRVVFLGIEAFD